MIGIYKITSPTGRIYIGQSVDIKRRWALYFNLNKLCKTTRKLYRSLEKYGPERHKFEVIIECTIDELNEKERYYQELYNAASDENLNCILTKTASKNGRGIKLSEERKLAVSKVHKGKKLSDETKAKVKLARSKQVITKAHRDAISANSGSARIVLNLDTGIYYRSAKEAAESHNINHNTLINNLIGRIKNPRHGRNLTYV